MNITHTVLGVISVFTEKTKPTPTPSSPADSSSGAAGNGAEGVTSGTDVFGTNVPYLPLWALFLLIVVAVGWYAAQRKQMQRKMKAKQFDGRTPGTVVKEYIRFWTKGDRKVIDLTKVKVKVGTALWATVIVFYGLAWLMPSLALYLLAVSGLALMVQVGRAAADSKAQKATTARLYEVCAANLAWGRQVTPENASAYITIDDWDGSEPSAVSIRISARDANKKDNERARFAAAFASVMPGQKRWVFDWDTTQMMITGVAEEPLPASKQKHLNQIFQICKANLTWATDTSIEAMDMYVDVVAWDADDAPTEVYIKMDPKDAKKSPNDRARFAYAFTQSMIGDRKWVFDWDVVNLHLRGVATEPLAPARQVMITKIFDICKANLSWDNDTTFECVDAYVKVNKWAGDEPADFDITISARDSKKKEEDRANFERVFSLAMSQDRRYVFEWYPNESRIHGTPTPPLPRLASLPPVDKHPWNEFPLGIGAGGKEVFWDCKVYPHSLVVGKTGSGKELECSTKIPTPTGWTTMGDLKVGDIVLDGDSQPTRVTWVSDVDMTPDLYEVVFYDGSVIEADAEHLWWTETRQSRMSQWQTDFYADDRKREGVVSPEGMDRIAALLAAASDMDEVTITSVTEAVGVHPTTGWVFDIANGLGPVGELQLHMTFEYKEQEVTQLQMTILVNAREAWTALAESPERFGRRNWGHLKSKCAELAANADPDADLTMADIAAVLCLRSRAAADDLMRRLRVPRRVEKRPTVLKVPAKTVTRPGAKVRTFNAKLMYEAVLEYGAKPWHDQRHKRSYGSVKTTLEIRDTLIDSQGFTNHSIPVAPAIELPERELPIAPYTLGAWLGDGNSRKGEVCGIDHEVADFMSAEGYETVALMATQASDHPDFRIWSSPRLHSELGALGMLQKTTPEGTHKHIPAIYQRASIAQRRALLAGLLDTDGTVAPQGTVQFTNTNKRIAYGVLELARGLGYRATCNEGIARLDGRDIGPKWTVAFTTGESPFFLTRKSVAHTERNTRYNEAKNNSRYIVDVRPVVSRPARCIAVDAPSRLFLAGEAMIPTHNSVIQRNILVHALSQPDEWQVALIDPKRVELGGYRVLSTKDGQGGVISIALTLPEQVDLLEKVEAEMMRRYDAMEAVGLNNAQNYIEPTTGRPPKAILLMVDEAYQLLAPESGSSDQIKENNEMHGRAAVAMGSIARLGRAAKIAMVVATQRPDAKVLGGELKALALDTPIPTPTGWTTMGEVAVGDVVFDETGQPCRVIDATEVMTGNVTYEVEFSDGEVIVADAGHQWTTHDWNYRGSLRRAERRSSKGLVSRPYTSPKTVTTKEIAETLMVHGETNHAVPVAKALQLSDTELPLSPYVLGVWLGDGNSYATTFTSVDDEVIENVRKEGFSVWCADQNASGISWRFNEVGFAPNRWRPGVKGTLRDLNVLENKHIPDQYLRSSREQRMALLQGLMDTDGTCARRSVRGNSAKAPVSQVIYVSVNERLARGVLELALSLGYRATIRPVWAKTVPNAGAEGYLSWHVRWTPREPVFRLSRKVNAQNLHGNYPSHRTNYRYITAVREVESVPVRCIMVDSPSHLYLAGSAMIPTHNSNLDCRIGCGTMDTIPSLMCFDDDSGTFITPVKGRAMIRQGGIPVEFQGYFFDSDKEDVNAHIRRGMVMRGVDLAEQFPRLYTGEPGAPGVPIEMRDDLLAEFDVPWENPYTEGVEIEDMTFDDPFAVPTERDADFSRPNRTHQSGEAQGESGGQQRGPKQGGKGEGILKRMYGKDYGS